MVTVVVVVRTSDQYFSHRSNEGPISAHRRRGNLCNNQSFAMSLVYHLAIFVRLYRRDDPLGINTAQKDQNPKLFETTRVAAHDIVRLIWLHPKNIQPFHYKLQLHCLGIFLL